MTDIKSITHILVGDEEIPISSFNEFLIKDGHTYMFNPQKGMMIPFDVNDKQYVQLFGISDIQIKQIKSKLEEIEQNSGLIIPAEHKEKFCALFAGNVMHSFDTRKELDEFRNGPDAKHILYSYYYAGNNN